MRRKNRDQKSQSTRRTFLKCTGASVGIGAFATRSAARAVEGKSADPKTSERRSQAAEADSVAIDETTELEAAQLPPAENEMSRRYLRMLEKWIPLGVEYFQKWPVRPRCGHFFGGVHWYGLETVMPAEAFAAASISPEYDEAAAGVSRAELRRMAVEAIRYLGFTHDTGPADCVRPAVGLGRPENCGTKWGERGKGFFKESQCGSVVATMAKVCLLLRDEVDDETWMMVARIHEDYARRFGDMSPVSGVYVNTQMEENAWTCFGLTSCFLFLSRHQKASRWESMARRWMFSTCAAPQDAKDRGMVGGRSAAALTGNRFTALPDYWAENHGMVHPSYTTSGVRSLMTVGCQLRLWGRQLPPELFWNRRRTYGNLKVVTDGSGYCQPIQGMDWHYLPPLASATPHAIGAVFFQDADAAALERRALRHAELRQEGNDGRMYDKALAEKAHDQQDPMIMRETGIVTAAQLYMLHRLFGPGPAPTPEDELEERLRGVRVFPHAGFVHHRHVHGQTSFSWRNSIMASPLTREGIYTIAPSSNSWLGAPRVKNRADSHRVVSVKTDQTDDAFATCLVMDRGQESLRQRVLFASLPDGRVLSWESFLALEDLVIESLDQGFLRITNETFRRLGPNSRGARTLYRPDGQKDYKGWLGDAAGDDLVERFGRPEWLNVDDRIGIRFEGPGETIYHNRHYFRPYRAVADDLILSRLAADQPLSAGEATPPLAALLVPEQKHGETAASELCLPTGPEHSASLASTGYLAAANFTQASRACTFTMARPQIIPAYHGATIEATGQTLRCRVSLGAWAARLLDAARTLRLEGDARIDTTLEGTICIHNIGSHRIRAEVASGVATGKQLSLASGEIKAIQ